MKKVAGLKIVAWLRAAQFDFRNRLGCGGKDFLKGDLKADGAGAGGPADGGSRPAWRSGAAQAIRYYVRRASTAMVCAALRLRDAGSDAVGRYGLAGTGRSEAGFTDGGGGVSVYRGIQILLMGQPRTDYGAKAVLP